MRSMFKWVTSMKEMLTHWHEFLLALVALGLKSGWFKAGVVPMIDSGSLAPMMATGVPDEVADQAPAASGCNDDKTVAKLRASCKNGSHMVAVLLASAHVHFACKVITTFSEPLQIEHAMLVKKLKGPDTVLDFYIDCANGGYHDTLTHILAKLGDRAELQFLGFDMDLDSWVASSGVSADWRRLVDAKVDEENKMGESIWSFVCNLLKYRGLSMAIYRDGFPGKFASLASRDTADVEKGLKIASQAWSAIEWAEKMHDNAGMMELLQQIPWARWVAVRETLVALSQWKFKWCPPHVREVWRSTFCSFGQSLVVEDVFNAVKDRQRDSKNLRMSRVRRFYHPIAERTIEDRYSRATVQPDELRRTLGLQSAQQVSHSVGPLAGFASLGP